MSILSRVAPLLFAIALPASVAACSSSTSSAPAAAAPTDPTPSDPEPPASATPPLREVTDARILARLKAGGVDIKKLGDLDTIIEDETKRKAVMESFTYALGTTCTGCHAPGTGREPDYVADTANKRITRKMWSEFVQQLTRADGTPIFCDTCHQGKMEFLDRTDDTALGNWMAENFVSKLARLDGSDQRCAGCHGEPFQSSIIGAWSK